MFLIYGIEWRDMTLNKKITLTIGMGKSTPHGSSFMKIFDVTLKYKLPLLQYVS